MAEVAELRARVARLERAMSRNSGNSSMPPSGDDAPGRSPPRKQRRAAERAARRKRGKQPGVPGAAVSMGPGLRALAVYLVVFQHVPIERCRDLIADVTAAQVSAGFIHSCLRTAADLAADMIKLIKTLITAAHVAGFDETTLRVGPAGQKKYVLGAVTEQHSLLFLGARTLESFRDFGILPSFRGVVVSGRYQNYFPGWEHTAGNQACLAHILRDYQDAAETYPGAIWPVQAQRALRGLIRAGHAARDDGQNHIPAVAADLLILEFRRAIRAGLASVPRIPGPKHSTAQHPGRDLLEFCRDREDAVLRFCTDTRVWPTNDLASYCTFCGGWEVRGLAGRPGGCRAGGFSVAGGSDILPWRAGAPGFAVGVAAA